MTTLHALYAQNPVWVWFGLAGLLVGLALAIARATPLAPALTSLGLGLLELAGLRLPTAVELGLILLALGAALAVRAALAKAVAKIAETATVAEPQADLVGRIGRTAGEFANGVGRVSLDGAEWSAELGFGEETAPPGALVRVLRVIGGVKLQVCAMAEPEREEPLPAATLRRSPSPVSQARG